MAAMSTRRLWLHVAILGGVYLAFGLSIAWYGATVPPYVGDLTRIGGLSEVAFGWREPQERFDPPLYVQHAYAVGSDVLIVGDSMTLHRPGEQTDPGSYWPNYLAQATGWRISAVHRNLHPIHEVLDSPEFRTHPPPLLIFEFAERVLVSPDRITAQFDSCGASPAFAVPRTPLVVQPMDVSPRPLPPPARSPRRIDFSLGAHHLKRRVIDWIAPWLREVALFELSRGGLFSSLHDTELLVYADDLRKVGMSPQHVARMGCALRALRDRVESDGQTVFLPLLIPDKLSAYRDVVRDLEPEYLDVFQVLATDSALRLPRLDLDFRAAVARGVEDLFLPNDTHLGVAGHRLVSAAALEALSRAGVAAAATSTGACPAADRWCVSTETIASKP